MNLRLRIREGWRALLRRLGVNTTLCPSCRYNNPRDCRHRTRPKAIVCEDYRRK